jgi:hypothetical protein
MGFVVAVAHATEMPDTTIGSAKEYAEEEEEEEEEDDNDVEFSRRSRSLLIFYGQAFPKWKVHLCCTFTAHKKRETLGRKKLRRRESSRAKERETFRVRKKERERTHARTQFSLSLSLSLSLCFVKEEPPLEPDQGGRQH